MLSSTMDGRAAADFVANIFRVDRADVASAKADLLSRVGLMEIQSISGEWAIRNSDSVPRPIDLNTHDLEQTLTAFARLQGRRFAYMLAATQLVQDGLAILSGRMVGETVSVE